MKSCGWHFIFFFLFSRIKFLSNYLLKANLCFGHLINRGGKTSFLIKVLLNNSMPNIKRELLPGAVYSLHQGRPAGCSACAPSLSLSFRAPPAPHMALQFVHKYKSQGYPQPCALPRAHSTDPKKGMGVFLVQTGPPRGGAFCKFAELLHRLAEPLLLSEKCWENITLGSVPAKAQRVGSTRALQTPGWD